MLTHAMKRISRYDRSGLDSLQQTVSEYYRVNDENGWPVKEHVGVTAASMLIKYDRPREGLAILTGMYQAERAAERPHGIVAMAVAIRGFLAIDSITGLRWAFKTVLKENMRIEQNFLHAVRAAVESHLRSNGKVSSLSASEAYSRAALVHWIQRCYDRRRSQMLETKVMGRRLLTCLTKCARQQEKPTLDVAVRGEVEDALFGRRMMPVLRAAGSEGAGEDAPSDELLSARRRVPKYGLRARRMAASIDRYVSEEPERRSSKPSRYYIRWLRQYRAYLRHDLTMGDGKVASFRYRLADNPKNTLAGKQRKAAKRKERAGLRAAQTLEET
ncbi:hypothetical protein LTR53_016318 [Teratosphaeriaceae sp. CCFEE 6253]|nr:hypothetical protein LTR53_016318 [Teratosphaeriaceae sp. CCFEE 6253]